MPDDRGIATAGRMDRAIPMAGFAAQRFALAIHSGALILLLGGAAVILTISLAGGASARCSRRAATSNSRSGSVPHRPLAWPWSEPEPDASREEMKRAQPGIAGPAGAIFDPPKLLPRAARVFLC